MAVSNSCETGTLKFNDVMGVLFSEEVHKKTSRSAETSGSALSVNLRGRSGNRDKKKNGRSKSKSGKGISKLRGTRCRRCGEMGHVQKDCKQKDGEGKGNEKDSAYITEIDGSDALILSSIESSKSWVIDFGASFHATSRHDIFQNYVKCGFEKV